MAQKEEWAKEKEELHHLIEELEKEKLELHEENERLKNRFSKLIGEIETYKHLDYGNFPYIENLADPQIHAMASNRLLGAQSAYDGVIKLIKEMEGDE